MFAVVVCMSAVVYASVWVLACIPFYLSSCCLSFYLCFSLPVYLPVCVPSCVFYMPACMRYRLTTNCVLSFSVYLSFFVYVYVCSVCVHVHVGTLCLCLYEEYDRATMFAWVCRYVFGPAARKRCTVLKCSGIGLCHLSVCASVSLPPSLPDAACICVESVKSVRVSFCLLCVFFVLCVFVCR